MIYEMRMKCMIFICLGMILMRNVWDLACFMMIKWDENGYWHVYMLCLCLIEEWLRFRCVWVGFSRFPDASADSRLSARPCGLKSTWDTVLHVTCVCMKIRTHVRVSECTCPCVHSQFYTSVYARHWSIVRQLHARVPAYACPYICTTRPCSQPKFDK